MRQREKRAWKWSLSSLAWLGCLGVGGVVACGPQNIGQFKSSATPQVTGTGVSGSGAVGGVAGAGGGGTVTSGGSSSSGASGLAITAYVTQPGGADDLASSMGPFTASFNIVDGLVDIYLSTTPTATQSSQASNYSGNVAYTVQTQCVTADCSSFAAYFIGNNMTTSDEVLVAVLYQVQGGGVVKMNEIDGTPFGDMTSVINALEGQNGVPL